MSMFSFQAIHNQAAVHQHPPWVVYRLCQCSLFKQFTTIFLSFCHSFMLFIDYVNVLFSSNSQQRGWFGRNHAVVYRLCQCSLFKQFTTIMSMFSFQAIHNSFQASCILNSVVYRLCQCSLFKQFTTEYCRLFHRPRLFIDYVNVLFSSNSQRTISFYFSMQRYDFFRTVPNLFFKVLKNKHFTFLIPMKVWRYLVVYRLCQCY